MSTIQAFFFIGIYVFKNYRICPVRIEIIHGRHRVVQIYTWLTLGEKFEYKGPAHV
jgi:hypothetical protein